MDTRSLLYIISRTAHLDGFNLTPLARLWSSMSVTNKPHNMPKNIDLYSVETKNISSRQAAAGVLVLGIALLVTLSWRSVYSSSSWFTFQVIIITL